MQSSHSDNQNIIYNQAIPVSSNLI